MAIPVTFREHPKKWISSIVGAIVLILNITCFCYSQLRYIPDEEYRALALIYASRHHITINAVDSIQEAQKYLQDNPECCQNLLAEDMFVSASGSRVLGYGATGVRVTLPAVVAEGKYKNYELYVVIDCCGSYRSGASHGIRVD